MRWGPWWSQSEEGPLAHARPRGGGPGGPKAPSCPCGGGLGGPGAKEAPTPMRWGPQWFPKRRRPPRPCAGGLGGPKAKEGPSPMRWGPRWSQSEGGPHAHHVVGTSVVPKRKRPGFAECPSYPTLGGGGLGGWVLAEFQAEVGVPTPPHAGWGAAWYQDVHVWSALLTCLRPPQGGPGLCGGHAHAAGASFFLLLQVPNSEGGHHQACPTPIKGLGAPVVWLDAKEAASIRHAVGLFLGGPIARGPSVGPRGRLGGWVDPRRRRPPRPCGGAGGGPIWRSVGMPPRPG